jgi:hypothetical protein
MRKLTLILAAFVIIISCEKNDSPCNCNNPLEDLSWLKDLSNSFTNCYCRMAIVQAKYKKQTVFYSIMNDPVCDGNFYVALRDCNGSIIKDYDYSQYELFFNEVTDRKELFFCKTDLPVK